MAEPLTNRRGQMIPINPKQIPQLFQKAQHLLSAGQIDQAEKLFQQIAQAAPKLAEAPFQLARIAVRRGDLSAAQAYLDQALTLKPAEPMIWRALAELSVLGDNPSANTALLARGKAARIPRDLYLELKATLTRKKPATDASLPSGPGPLLALARAQRDRGELDRALGTVGKALGAGGANLPALALKADILHRDGQHQAAAATYRKMLRIRPGDCHAMTGLALVLSAQSGMDKAARDAFDTAIKAHPNDNQVLFHKAQFLQDKGEFKEAEALLRQAVNRDPKYGEAYLALSRSLRFKADDPLIAQMAATLSGQGMPVLDRARIGFAMAKAMEDTQSYDQVFGYLNRANARFSAASAAYDDSQSQAMFDGLKAAFRGVDFNRPVDGTSDLAPIFVTGLPRSGTTLVERILSNHPTLTAIGEAPHLMHAQQEILARQNGGFHDVARMPDAQIARFSAIYEQEVTKRHGPGRVVDKAMMTLHIAGLVKLALPRSKIILVRRDPRDIALSMYKNVFPVGSYRYSYNLVHLGRFIRMYEDMINFWRDAAPGMLIEVQYEDLIDDPDGQSGKLIDQLGLTRTGGLVDVQKAKAEVRTLSVYQARQPIYKSSARSWEKYKDDLAPLIATLGELAD